MAELRNKVSHAELKARLLADPTPRTTISFYRYHNIEDVKAFRDELFREFSALGVLGRIFVASEGINAQLSVPTANFERFREYLYSFPFLNGIRLNIAVDDDGKSFWVLTVRQRPRIVADGIEDPTFSVARSGRYLTAEQFNSVAGAPDTVLVDMRNYYEYEVGHFEGAREIPSDTFREQLPMAVDLLQDQKDKRIVMYCTGGIRCEKASAYLRHHGFPEVYHLEGGIIEYVRQAREKGLEMKFRGKNFVFDNRLAERITPDVLAQCHQCGAPCDEHQNCANDACHLLFIQCAQCAARYAGCCSEECQTVLSGQPVDETAGQEPGAPTVEAPASPAPQPFGNSRSRRVRWFDRKDAKSESR